MMNPWLGLSSYSESSIKDYQFNGISEAINALAELIRQNLFVTLYGRSGIGKTSLLQAGVFPVLRKDGMFPISIRLNELIDDEKNTTKIIWSRICDVLKEQGCNYRENTIDPYIPDFSDALVLRKLFSSGRFVDKEGLTVIPVIVLDQFEEFLYNSPKSSRVFVSQLYALIDDNVNFKVPHPSWHDDTDFRIVVSIREDDLFLLEDLIDSLNFEDLKSNRYRLLPVSENGAKEIILNPSKDKGFFEEGQEEAIADEIIKICKTNGDSINTLMLSLTCYVLCNNYVLKNQRISLFALRGYKDVLETYYLEAVKNLPKSQRFYLEDNLVDGQGRRTSIYLSDLEKRAPKAKDLIGDCKNRLLTVNQGRVELIHDQLASSIAKNKTSRRSRKTKQIGIFSLITGLIILFVFSFSHPDKFDIKVSEVVTSKEYVTIENSTSVKEYIIERDDDFYGAVTYIVSSCPNLRLIKIDKEYVNLRIFNCPRLTKIELLDNFRGQIDVFNCPNLSIGHPHVNIVRDWTDFQFILDGQSRDSLRFHDFNSEYELRSILLPKNFYDTIRNKYYYIASPNYVGDSIRYYGNHWVKGILGYGTGIPDSLKIKTDLYVPFGMSDYYKNLNMFMPFRSVNELPFYSLWLPRFKGTIIFFDKCPIWAIVTVIALLMLQLTFWIIGFYIYRRKPYKRLCKLFIVFAYGIGMSFIGVISFMAFYWFVFIILLPFSQIVSIIAGIIGCLTCLLIIYNNAFYTIFSYIKENGTRFLFRDIAKEVVRLFKIIALNIRTHRKIIIWCLLTILGITIGCLLYFSGKNKRLEYLSQLKLEANFVRVPQIIAELETQHSSPFYGFFLDSIKLYKEKLDNDSITLLCKITPAYLSSLAKERNIDIKASWFAIRDNAIEISADGTKQCINAYDIKNDKNWLLYYDMKSELVDTIIGLGSSQQDLNISFSPSAENVLLSVDNKIYNYSTSDNVTTTIPIDLKENVKDLLMKDDETFFLISNNTLYEGHINGDPKLIELDNEDLVWYDDLIMLGADKVAANSRYFKDARIYDLNTNTVSTLSAEEQIGSLIGVTTSNKLVAQNGFFNLDSKNEFIPFDDHIGNKAVEGDMIFTVSRSIDEANYNIKNAISGQLLKPIYIHKDDGYSRILGISQNGNYLMTSTMYSIFIYPMKSTNIKDWPLTDRQKRIFNLK